MMKMAKNKSGHGTCHYGPRPARAEGRAAPADAHCCLNFIRCCCRWRWCASCSTPSSAQCPPCSCRISLPLWTTATNPVTGLACPAGFWAWWACLLVMYVLSLIAGFMLHPADGHHHPGLTEKAAREDVQPYAGPAHHDILIPTATAIS